MTGSRPNAIDLIEPYPQFLGHGGGHGRQREHLEIGAVHDPAFSSRQERRKLAPSATHRRVEIRWRKPMRDRPGGDGNSSHGHRGGSTRAGQVVKTTQGPTGSSTHPSTDEGTGWPDVSCLNWSSQLRAVPPALASETERQREGRPIARATRASPHAAMGRGTRSALRHGKKPGWAATRTKRAEPCGTTALLSTIKVTRQR
jgi:hypothetical protein